MENATITRRQIKVNSGKYTETKLHEVKMLNKPKSRLLSRQQ